MLMLQHGAQQRMDQQQQVVVTSAPTHFVLTPAAFQSPPHGLFVSSPAANSGAMTNATQQPPSPASPFPNSTRSPAPPHAPPTPSPSPGVLLRSPASQQQQQQQQASPQPAYHIQQTQRSPAPPPLTPVHSPSPNITPPVSNTTTIPVLHQALQAGMQQLMASPHQLVQIIQSAGGRTQLTVAPAPTMQPVVVRPKQPQLLPKPANGGKPAPSRTTTTTSVTNTSNSQSQQGNASQNTTAQSTVQAQATGTQQLLIGQNPMLSPHGLLLNPVLPALFQQPGTGVQFILRPQQSPSPQQGNPQGAQAQAILGGCTSHKTGTVMMPGQGGQAVLIHHPIGQQARGAVQQQQQLQAQQQVLRLITGGPMQLQQIQTSNGPTLIAVPSGPTLSFQQLPQLRGPSPGIIQQQQQPVTISPMSNLQHVVNAQQQQQLINSLMAQQQNAVVQAAIQAQPDQSRRLSTELALAPGAILSPPPNLPQTPSPQQAQTPQSQATLVTKAPSPALAQVAMNQLQALKKKPKAKKKKVKGKEGEVQQSESKLNLADIMKSAGIGDEDDVGMMEESEEQVQATPVQQQQHTHIQQAAPSQLIAQLQAPIAMQVCTALQGYFKPPFSHNFDD